MHNEWAGHTEVLHHLMRANGQGLICLLAGKSESNTGKTEERMCACEYIRE